MLTGTKIICYHCDRIMLPKAQTKRRQPRTGGRIHHGTAVYTLEARKHNKQLTHQTDFETDVCIYDYNVRGDIFIKC